MLDREQIQSRVSAFRARYGVQDRDEHVVACMHLMNAFRLDLASAQDRTSHGSADYGIDAWHYDADMHVLRIFQSKLSAQKRIALDGLKGLTRAAEWLGGVLSTGDMGTPPKNPAIRNLGQALHCHRDSIRDVEFILLTPFNPNELEDASDYDQARRTMVPLPLNALLAKRSGRFKLLTQMYDLSEGGIPAALSAYPVSIVTHDSIDMGKTAKLKVTFLRLAALVGLFRQRGNHLFEKNVRLFLTSREAKDRLGHPLEDTFDRITKGELDANIFPFYHVGLTLTVGSIRSVGEELLLETPSVINGCQTINIASRYLEKLEKEKDATKIERFRSIPVLAKLVIAASDDQVREIANCNNRQNPIESWQLFSNDPIHVRMEEVLADVGVYYERQKGKFEAEMGKIANQARYAHTNGTRITVQDLGQIIALARRDLQLAAKPSDIYASKESHDQIFDWPIAEHVRDVIWAFNARKAVRKGLDNYLSQPSLDNPLTHKAFRTPLVRQYMYYLATMYLYQKEQDLLPQYGYRLNKSAPKGLVDATERFYRRVVTRMKDWYLRETERGKVKIASKRLDAFIDSLAQDVGLDLTGAMPFTESALDWAQFEGGSEASSESEAG